MKKFKTILLILACIFSVTVTRAQFKKLDSTASTNHFPPVYVGLATGINNYTGIIGVGADVRLYHTLFLRVGAGIGTWGTKFTGALRYDLGITSGFAFELGYSYCTGIGNFTINTPVDSAGSTLNRTVTMNLLATGTVNLQASYNIVFKNQNEFFFNFGYAVAVQSTPYEVTNGYVLDPASVFAFNIIRPGGFIVSCGFMFAL